MRVPDDASATAADSSGSSWGWAAACSVAAHALLAVLASSLPEGKRSGGAARDQLFTPGAVIPIEAVDPAFLARAEPIPEPSPEPLGPAPSSEPPSPAKAPIDHPKSSNPEPSSGTSPPPEPTQAHAEPSKAPGLALHGLRDNARASTGSGKVIVDPSLLAGSREIYEDSAVPEQHEAPIQGPAPAPSGKDYVFSKEKGKLVYRDPAGRFVATLTPDGRVNFRNKGAKATWTNIGMAGPGDILNAAAGQDPYARIKAALLKATFEMRLGMAIDFQKRQLDKRLRRLESELDKIWADERRGLPARKELLFQRWDECDEPDAVATGELPGFGAVENSELDEARKNAASSARKRILKFIRERAPKDSAEAFTAAELADMNRRRASKQKFEPYQ